MKEIHFYKDLVGIALENYFNLFHYTHNATVKSINNDISRIYTTAISALNFFYYLIKDTRYSYMKMANAEKFMKVQQN